MWSLGAMLAGMVLRSWTHPRVSMDVTPLEGKLDAVGYGFFIPVFFVASGMTLDVRSIIANPLRLFVFFVLLLVVRGLPSLLVYRHALPVRPAGGVTFITATTMPLLIALAVIGLSDGVMIPGQCSRPGRGRCAVGARLPVDRGHGGPAGTRCRGRTNCRYRRCARGWREPPGKAS